jgi:uncharacterized membrane protein
MRLWFIPMVYVGGSIACGFVLPRIEDSLLGLYHFNLSVASAQAYLSAVASGMMALTGIVFAMAFVVVQFSAIAYSPRLVLLLGRDYALFHSLGAFAATFIYALCTLAWVDRGGSGAVPLFSALLVGIMLAASMLLFARLVQRVSSMQITNVLHLIGNKGRQVIAETFQPLADQYTVEEKNRRGAAEGPRLGPATQTLKYSGEPRTIAKFDIAALVRQAQGAKGVIVMRCAVGDALATNTVLLQVHGAEGRLSERELMRAISLDLQRTFEQDPKYPIRLLVDIAIKALSPAINDPTTAVQTIGQLEDLLHRLSTCQLGVGHVKDTDRVLRLVFPMPTWQDYLTLLSTRSGNMGQRQSSSCAACGRRSSAFWNPRRAPSELMQYADILNTSTW